MNKSRQLYKKYNKYDCGTNPTKSVKTIDAIKILEKTRKGSERSSVPKVLDKPSAWSEEQELKKTSRRTSFEKSKICNNNDNITESGLYEFPPQTIVQSLDNEQKKN